MFDFLKRKNKIEPIFEVLGVDMHNHMVPGVDDGSESLEMSAECIGTMWEAGFRKMFVTPHFNFPRYNNDEDDIVRRYGELKQYLADSGVEMELQGIGGEYRIDDGFGDLQHLRYVFEQSSSGSFSGHFLHRAAEINIDKVGFGRLYDTCRISHRFGFPSVYLNGYRSLRIVNRQFACRRSDIAHQGIGVHKLRINTIRSVAFAKHAEGRIGNILHGSEI